MIWLLCILFYFIFGLIVWYLLTIICPDNLKRNVYSFRFIKTIVLFWLFLIIIDFFKLTFKK
jgi:hypothetical protein